MSALTSNHTLDLVPPPSHANIFGCRWLYSHKFDSNGNLERYKGRLVVQGFSQLPGLDFDDTFSHFVKPDTISNVLSIIVSKHWLIHQLDVKNDFLHGDLTAEVYMQQPPVYIHPYGDLSSNPVQHQRTKHVSAMYLSSNPENSQIDNFC